MDTRISTMFEKNYTRSKVTTINLSVICNLNVNLQNEMFKSGVLESQKW